MSLSRWEEAPLGLRVLEAVVRPVFHKETINRYAGIYKEDPLLITAVIKVESKFFIRARSSRGAIGLMQVMPQTAKEIARELKIQPFKESSLEEPETNIRFGFHYIAKLRKEFGDDDVTVLAAYNAGKKNVKEWLKANRKKKLSTEELEFLETKKFVQEVLSTYNWLKKAQRWRSRILNLYR